MKFVDDDDDDDGPRSFQGHGFKGQGQRQHSKYSQKRRRPGQKLVDGSASTFIKLCEKITFVI